MYNPFHRLLKRHVGHAIECRTNAAKVVELYCPQCAVVLVDAEPNDQPDVNADWLAMEKVDMEYQSEAESEEEDDSEPEMDDAAAAAA